MSGMNDTAGLWVDIVVYFSLFSCGIVFGALNIRHRLGSSQALAGLTWVVPVFVIYLLRFGELWHGR